MTNKTAAGICLVKWKPESYADEGSGIFRKLSTYLRNYSTSNLRIP